MEYLILIFVHVLFGIFWAGGAIVAGFFILPAVVDAGPAGGAVMAGVVRRRLPVIDELARCRYSCSSPGFGWTCCGSRRNGF